jgi:hypothetical protein
MRSLHALAGLLVFSLCMASDAWVRFQEGESGTPIPAWTTLLPQSFGNARNPGAPKYIDPSRASVLFLDDQRVVAYQVVLTGQLSSRENLEQSSAFALNLRVLATSSGKTIDEKTWRVAHT